MILMYPFLAKVFLLHSAMAKSILELLGVSYEFVASSKIAAGALALSVTVREKVTKGYTNEADMCRSS